MEIRTLNDVVNLRECVDLDHIVIHLNQLDEGYLPLYVAKYGIWALKRGGTLKINCKHTMLSHTKVNGNKSFYYTLQLIMKSIRHYGILKDINYNDRSVEFIRSTPPAVNEGWSFGVIYSGEDSEWNNLCNCVKSIQSQVNFTRECEVVVCGPRAKRDFVVRELDVKYLCVDTTHKFDRFEISHKKNLLIDALRHDKILICHTRIILKHNCIKMIPRDFEVLTPRVFIQGLKNKLPYLDLGFIINDNFNLNYARMKPCFYEREHWLRYVRNAMPYVDGGLFCINTKFVKNNRLCETLAWGEAEDVDWSRRVIYDGFITELCTQSVAISQTCKMSRYEKYGHSKLYKLISNFKQIIT